jgi:hypothetical protein
LAKGSRHGVRSGRQRRIYLGGGAVRKGDHRGGGESCGAGRAPGAEGIQVFIEILGQRQGGRMDSGANLGCRHPLWPAVDQSESHFQDGEQDLGVDAGVVRPQRHIVTVVGQSRAPGSQVPGDVEPPDVRAPDELAVRHDGSLQIARHQLVGQQGAARSHWVKPRQKPRWKPPRKPKRSRTAGLDGESGGRRIIQRQDKIPACAKDRLAVVL